MIQAATSIPSLDRIVNVSSVPQRSPFRYPGGKTWLVPLVRKWLGSLETGAARLVEPFAGGGIVGLTAAFEGLAKQVVMVELDADVGSVWQTVLNGGGESLARRIMEFHCDLATVKRTLATCPVKLPDIAFRTLLRNRVQHGGILAHGASLMKNGENGKGITSRWYPETLARRIRDIAGIKERISFIQGDGISYLQKTRRSRRTVYFVDPPYTIAGRRLYTHAKIDHEKLFRILSRTKGDFLMTYDDAAEIRSLAEQHGFAMFRVSMQGRLNTKKKELLIGKNLDWVREASPVFPTSS